MFSATLITLGAFFTFFGMVNLAIEVAPSRLPYDATQARAAGFIGGFGLSLILAGCVWRYLASGFC